MGQDCEVTRRCRARGIAQLAEGSAAGFRCSCVSQAMQSQGISHAVQLEQWLMEGAYNKVLEARPQLPHPAYSYFMEKLLSTVRWPGFPLSPGI